MSISPIFTLELKFLTISLWLGFIFLASVWLSRYPWANAEIIRKVVHIGSGNAILLAWFFDIPAWVGIAASIVFSAIALLSYSFPILPGINGIGRQSWGTFFYAVSIGLLIALFWPLHQPYYAALGILIMTWGDALAALVGQNFGTHPYSLGTMQKTWEGSATMFTVSYLICVAILLPVYGNVGLIWISSAIVALFATFLEAFSRFGIDNLTVPLGSAILAFALMEGLNLGEFYLR